MTISPVQAQLRQRRRAVGLYAITLAQYAGLSPAYLSLMESGLRRANPEQLRRLDNVLIQYERAARRVQQAQAARSVVSVSV